MPKSVLAVRRILKDFQEVLENPLKNVVATPLEDDLFCWHGNVRGDEGALEGVVIHFQLIFHDTYPNVEPKVYLFSPVPHPNVRPALQPSHDGTRRWKLAIWDCVPSFKGWTSGYTVLSILNQLQAFLLQEDLLYDTRHTSIEELVEHARGLTCACGHKGRLGHFQPALWSSSDNPPKQKKKVYVCCPVLSARKLAPSTATATLSENAVQPLPPSTIVKPSNESPSTSESNEEAAWITVHRKYHLKTPSMAAPETPSFSPLKDSTPLNNFYAALDAEYTDGLNDGLAVDDILQKPSPVADAPPSSSAPPQRMSSKGFKKRQARSKKRQLAQNPVSMVCCSTPAPPASHSFDLATASPTTLPTLPPAEGPASSRQPLSASALPAPANWGDIGEMTHRELIQRIYQSCRDNVPTPLATRMEISGEAMTATADQQMQGSSLFSEEWLVAMGSFAILDQECLQGVLSLLAPPELGAVASTCRGMRAACEDGLVWKTLLERMYPQSYVCGASLRHWKHAFLLEYNNIVDELRCFHTKSTYEEDVLGLPVRYTINPVKKTAEYIEAYPDLLSVSAFQDAHVRHNLHNEAIQELLPLYLTEEHFKRSRRQLELCVARLHRPESGTSRGDFSPSMLLEVIPRVLNTTVVLLVDQGIAASEKALDCYCMVHRLLLAACKHYGLGADVRKRVQRFITHEKSRVKGECPSIGDFIPLIGVDVTRGATGDGQAAWLAASRSLIGEVLDRSVLWICKHDPQLAISLRKSPKNQDADMQLLAGAFDAIRVSLRLIMFHVGFLRLVARPPSSMASRCFQVVENYDMLYGRPSLTLKRRFQAYVKAVIAVDSFPAFFNIVGLQVPSPAHFTALLRSSWERSLLKGYHKRGMDFARVQQSGVSKILLKGQSYTAPPNLKTVVMQEHWQWIGGHTQYLDASCLVYNWKGEHIGHVDFLQTRWPRHEDTPSLTHSGDIIQDGKGTHTIKISMHMLPSYVKALYFTMSGYRGATLSDFRLPYVSLSEEHGMEMCQYNFEKTKQADTMRAIVMCRLIRKSPGTSWSCEAIGDVCMGSADNYVPIFDFIKQNCC